MLRHLLTPALALLCATALAQSPPPPIEIAKVRDKLALLSDGKGHYVAVVPMEIKRQLDYPYPVFYGDGKRFFAQRITGASANGPKYSYGFNEPRLANTAKEEGEGDVSFDGKAFTLSCGERQTALQLVNKTEAATLLAATSFEPRLRKTRPYALARDERGRYYYVDRGTTPETAKQFRLFAGPKGNLKPQKMTNIVSDSEGDVFATRSGSLRLILGKGEATWIEKKKGQKLTMVPVDFNKNVAMIYNELGVYTGERLGTPCDDL